MRLYLKQLPIILLLAIGLNSCSSDDEDIILKEPTISNVEIGLSNNETGVIGRDFHFNAEILAGDKIDLVQIKIEPINGETYASPWSYEITWDEFKGIKNATVHEHFDIPENAIEGNYDFIIVITDENGTVLEEKRNITIILAENLPVDPFWGFISVGNLETGRNAIRYDAYSGVSFGDPDNTLYMGELFNAGAFVYEVKGDGQLYVVLIKKDLNHKPHTIDAIDYSKTIIWDIHKHTGIESPELFGNEDAAAEIIPELLIGAEFDNNEPTANAISGSKAWEEGDYYLGFLYENTTYNISIYHYFEVTLEIE